MAPSIRDLKKVLDFILPCRSETYHVSLKIILLFLLESLQVTHDTLSGVFDITFRDFQSLLKVSQALSRLPNLISPGSLGINVHETVHGVSETAEYFVRDEIAAW